MIALGLKIRYRESARREPVAWLIAGASPERWLDELLAWQAPLTDVALYVVPQSAGDLSPRGLFVVVPQDCRPRTTPCSQPYGRLGGRLYLPVEAVLDPQVLPSELASLLTPAERVYLFHPVAGLVGFDPADRLAIHDLLELPSPTDTAWDRARPGIAVQDRLLSILPECSVDADSLLREGQDDIATRLPSLEELPPGPQEPRSSMLPRLGRNVRRQFARLVSWVTGLRPRREKGASEKAPQADEPAGRGRSGRKSGSTLGSWPGKAAAAIGGMGAGAFGKIAARAVTGIGQWAERQLSRLDASMLAARHREITRLLDLLSKAPDRALRYAIPLGAGGHRSGGPPGDRLPKRDVDFNLARLSSAGPVDFWDLPAEMREQLFAKYMELADRELRLGRHRRAAYIFGELLGRIDLAASALAAGQFWREAAELYLRRLGRPDEAARCLQQGGLWSEAIALYEEIARYEEAGDLCLKIDQPVRAAEFYRLAVTEQLASGDRLSAARILVDKLDAPEEALLCLESGWPHSPQAGKCLEEIFRLLGRLGRHDQAQARIKAMRAHTLPGEQTVILVRILADLTHRYPADDVRATAADTTRTIVSSRLSRAMEDESESLLAAIRRLVPGDRLLDRDCRRYLKSPREPFRAAPAPAAPAVLPTFQVKRSPLRPMLLHEILLSSPDRVNWQCAVGTDEGLFAAGYLAGKTNPTLVLGECFWNGHIRAMRAKRWRIDNAAPGPALRAILLTADPSLRQPLWVYAVDQPPLELVSFGPTDDSPSRVQAGTPPWMPEHSLAAARTPDGLTWILSAPGDGLVLHTFSSEGRPVASRLVATPDQWAAWLDGQPPVLPIPLHVRKEGVYAGIGERLVILRSSNRTDSVALPRAALSLAGSPPHSRSRIVVGMAIGAAVYWDGLRSPLELFAQDLQSPLTGFTRSGWLVAANAHECHVYRAEGGETHLEAVLSGNGIAPVAILACPHPDQFALVQSSGAVRIYRLGRR